MAKGFDHSAPCGAIVPVSQGGHPTDARITLQHNGVIKQDARISDLIWSVPELLANLSRFVRLQAGDLAFTGTPAGVGAVERGDRLVATVDGVGQVSVRIE